jgi:hypothetical protein
VISAKPPERSLDSDADSRRAGVEDTRTAACVRDDAELRGQHHAFAATLDGAADELLVRIRTVDLGGIKMCHAEIKRSMNRANRLGIVYRADVVVRRHRHGAESNARDVKPADRDVLHVSLGAIDADDIDLPVISHVTRASTREPFLGMSSLV